ncbi:Protein YIPF [Rhynchospora pubera]|uniref:Protein YIP n=1 Tax=Rhynchospora pubera TaxID=906938 RepID=A0AAV8GMU6_9POAL|nr:Protein YIPF [Rhynchospora pubera]KAJ4804945.1 Protein YIPF [Rhynchospora pubera]
MAKEFSVRPVIFPSSTPSTPYTRRPGSSSPPPPFQTAPRTSSPLPFIPFDIPSTSSAPPPLYSGVPIASSSSGYFEDEPPLLEELGINTRQIWRKTVSILNPIRLDPVLHEDGDLSGPFMFLLSFGLFQLLAGKFYFGIVLGWVIMASLFLYSTFNMIAGRNGCLDLYRCFSIIGYCMLPMVIFSAGSLFLPHGGTLIFAIGMVFVFWSTWVCTSLLLRLASCGDEHRGLVGYACWLVYLLFSLLVIF